MARQEEDHLNSAPTLAEEGRRQINEADQKHPSGTTLCVWVVGTSGL